MTFGEGVIAVCVSALLFAVIYYYYKHQNKQLISYLESLGISEIQPGDDWKSGFLVGSWGEMRVHILHRRHVLVKDSYGARRLEQVSFGLGIANIKELTILHSSSEGFDLQSEDPALKQAILQDSRCSELITSYIRSSEDRIDIEEGMITATRMCGRTDFDLICKTLAQQFQLAQAIRSALEPIVAKAKLMNITSSVCPFCRDTLGGTYVVECSLCRTFHHDACWIQNQGCSIFGCKGEPVRIAPPAKQIE